MPRVFLNHSYAYLVQQSTKKKGILLIYNLPALAYVSCGIFTNNYGAGLGGRMIDLRLDFIGRSGARPGHDTFCSKP